MSTMVMKVDPDRSTDRYVIWDAATDAPSVVGTRQDMIGWLMSPRGACGYAHALRIMQGVDRTGTSNQNGRGGWEDLVPLPVGDIAPDDGWYQMDRNRLPELVDAIAREDLAAIHRLLIKYA